MDEALKEVEEEIKLDEALMEIKLDLNGDDDDDEDFEEVEELTLPVDDDEVQMSLLELDEAEMEIAEAIELDFDDGDDGDENVEKMTLPLVSKWMLPNYDRPIHGLEVPVMKDDEFIQDSMYRDDFEYGIRKYPPPHVFDSPLPTKEAAPLDRCSICFKRWTALHRFCCLPCGHIFGAQCIKKWLETNSSMSLSSTCPQCNMSCWLKDVRPLLATPISLPAADKGVVDQEIFTRRFPFTKQGVLKYKKFEIGRRNFALKKRSDAKKRLTGVQRRKNDLLKRRTDLLDRRASVQNRAKALEQQGGSLCRADALRLGADALGRWADEYLRRAEACEGRATALTQKARSYNQRVKAFDARLQFYCQSYDNFEDEILKNTTRCAATATCHKD